MNCHSLRRGMALTAATLLTGLAAATCAEPFPYGQELRLDVDPMRGSKKVPILAIGAGGPAEIDLWCNSVRAQLVVAGDTLTIITAAPSVRSCPLDRTRADEELIAALNQVTNWRMEDRTLVLIGATTLRFVVQTN